MRGPAYFRLTEKQRMVRQLQYVLGGRPEAAELEDFRLHEILHPFATNLVMDGVDLNTVRELMGHAGLKRAIRYALLALKVKRFAVSLLDVMP